MTEMMNCGEWAEKYTTEDKSLKRTQIKVSTYIKNRTQEMVANVKLNGKKIKSM